MYTGIHCADVYTKTRTHADTRTCLSESYDRLQRINRTTERHTSAEASNEGIKEKNDDESMTASFHLI